MFVGDFETIKPTNLRTDMAGDEQDSEVGFLLSECDGEIASIFIGQGDVGNQEIDDISVSFKHSQCVVVGSGFNDHVILAVQNVTRVAARFSWQFQVQARTRKSLLASEVPGIRYIRRLFCLELLTAKHQKPRDLHELTFSLYFTSRSVSVRNVAGET
jgi:hypothetical protein